MIKKIKAKRISIVPTAIPMTQSRVNHQVQDQFLNLKRKINRKKLKKTRKKRKVALKKKLQTFQMSHTTSIM